MTRYLGNFRVWTFFGFQQARKTVFEGKKVSGLSAICHLQFASVETIRDLLPSKEGFNGKSEQDKDIYLLYFLD